MGILWLLIHFRNKSSLTLLKKRNAKPTLRCN
jgi:hypothetical protein